MKIILLSIALLFTCNALAAETSETLCNKSRELVAEVENDKTLTVKAVKQKLSLAKQYAQIHCIDNNHIKTQYQETVRVLQANIRRKYEGVDGEAKAEQSAIKDNLSALIALNNKYQGLFSEHAKKVSAFSQAIRDSFANSFNTFASQLTGHVTQANSTTNSIALNGVIRGIRELVYEEQQAVNTELAELTLLQIANQQLETRYLGELDTLSAAIDDIAPELELDFNIPVLTEIESYIKRRSDQVGLKYEKLLASLDKKSQALFNQEVATNLSEAMQDSVYLTRSNSFYNTMQVLVNNFQTGETSSFYNMRYQKVAWDNAKALLDAAEFCQSSSVTSWQTLGCQRIKSFENNANLALTSNIPFGIQFALRALAFLGDASPEPEKQAYIQRLLDEGRIEEAAIHIDDLLTKAGELL